MAGYALRGNPELARAIDGAIKMFEREKLLLPRSRSEIVIVLVLELVLDSVFRRSDRRIEALGF